MECVRGQHGGQGLGHKLHRLGLGEGGSRGGGDHQGLGGPGDQPALAGSRLNIRTGLRHRLGSLV